MMTGTGIATEALTETETETRGTGATSGTAEDGNKDPIGTAVPTNAIEDLTGRYLNAVTIFLALTNKCRPLSPQRRPGICFICFASVSLTNRFIYFFSFSPFLAFSATAQTVFSSTLSQSTTFAKSFFTV